MKKSYDFSKAKRGAVLPAPPGKTRITIRLDDDVLEWFRKQAHRAGGASYQTMINEALREWVETQREPLEDTLRRVLTEVLEEDRPSRRRASKKKARAKKAAKKARR
jgi:metal-responsive CopG/Arc/MetJ family transcriptional regulator